MPRKVFTRRMQDTLPKALTVKTPQGRANYLIDLVAEDVLHDHVLDSMLHGINEVVLAGGPLNKTLQAYIRKPLKCRGLG